MSSHLVETDSTVTITVTGYLFVANSATDAEVYAATLAIKEIIYLRDSVWLGKLDYHRHFVELTSEDMKSEYKYYGNVIVLN
jgi:hypothetical protein